MPDLPPEITSLHRGPSATAADRRPQLAQKLLSLATLAMTGCSFIGVHGLGSPPITARDRERCTTSYSAPVVDAVVFGGLAALTMGFAFDTSSQDGNFPSDMTGAAYITGPMAAAYLVSSLFGAERVSKCRKARREPEVALFP